MGIFSINRFDKPGPGLDKNEPEKKRFFLFWDIFFRKFWKLIPLSLLYAVFCLPIITIGPATAGFTYVLRNYSQQQHSFMLSDFWDAFKKNFKYSFIVSVLDALIIVLMVVAIPFYYDLVEQNTMFYVPFAVCLSGAFVALMMNYYIFLMIVSLELNLKQMIKNAFLLSIAGIKSNIITTIIVLLFVAGAILTFPYLTIFYYLFMAVIGFSFLGLLICFNSYQHILKFVVEPYYAKQARLEPIEEKEEEEPIFKDMGREETPVKITKKRKSKKTIQ